MQRGSFTAGTYFVGSVLLTLLLLLSAPVVDATTNLTVRIVGNNECEDGVDNDSDGETDYPEDDGCNSYNDNNEADPATPITAGNSGGGGGGGGGGSPLYNVDIPASVVLRGLAYPGSKVSIMQDGQLIAQVQAGLDARFEIEVSNVSSGTHTFGVWGADSKGRRSTTQAFAVSVTPSVTTLISGIFLGPTIAVDKIEVRRGEIVTVLGQAVPSAQVRVEVNSEHQIFDYISADTDGTWSYQLDTNRIEYGEHTARSRAELEGDFSAESAVVGFKVGTKTVASRSVCTVRADLNGDCFVNLVDFSIMAYWYERSNVPVHVDLSGDSKVDLIDFSIMAFNWTG